MTAPDSLWLAAFNRFGLGARPGAAHDGGDPRDAVVAELNAPDAALLNDRALPQSKVVLQSIYAYNERKRLENEGVKLVRLSAAGMPAPNVAGQINLSPLTPALPAPSPAATGMTATGMAATGMPATPAMGGGMAGDAGKPMAPEPPPEQLIFRNDALARITKAIAAPVGFVERLVAFWSNHFCVSVAKSGVGRGCAGAFEREAIRPHVLGKFADMLQAVEQHPAMLNFLDNAQSVGPNSKAGQNRKVGLNENLAREILELHTMGVGSGYTQADVTSLARVITGWTIVGREGKLGEPGTFAFNANAHEPGGASVLGRFYAQDGVAQGQAVLADLARSPATANHIARKLVRHFIADAPNAALVQRLAKVFADSDGDLRQVSTALASDDAAWRAPLTKIRNPWELAIAAQRAFARAPDQPGPVLNVLNLLGMPLWQPAGPNGFSEDNAAWASPEGMKMRLSLAAQLGRPAKDTPAPLALLDQVLGPAVSSATRQAITRAESPEQAYALLVMSPEFQRR